MPESLLFKDVLPDLQDSIAQSTFDQVFDFLIEFSRLNDLEDVLYQLIKQKESWSDLSKNRLLGTITTAEEKKIREEVRDNLLLCLRDLGRTAAQLPTQVPTPHPIPPLPRRPKQTSWWSRLFS